jgi:ATP-dependent DNA helicase RecQ
VAAHPDLGGRYVWHRSASVQIAARRLMETVARWIDEGVEPSSIGVLARSRPTGLHRLRSAAERVGVPFAWTLPGDSSLPMTRVREVAALSDWLRSHTPRDERIGSVSVMEQIRQLPEGPWRNRLEEWVEPLYGRRLIRSQWQYELISWAQLERRTRVVGKGIHLGTMHSAKGLEFDHVLLLDDGTLADTAEERRLLYVALTRAHRSLQIFSSYEPSPVFAALRHPSLEVRDEPMRVADPGTASDYEYGFLGLDSIWLDWLGRQPGDHPGHRALREAEFGDHFEIRPDGSIVDSVGHTVALLSQSGREIWLPRAAQQLKLRLIAAVRERADAPKREAEYQKLLRVNEWLTAVWEARWLPARSSFRA